MKRVAIVGCIGAGKSTLARQLGSALDLPVIHLDRHWWQDGQYVIEGRRTARVRTLPQDEYHRFQEHAAAAERWVIDGGVDGLEIRLARADTAIFLDLPLPVCAWRVVRRTGKPREDYPPQVRESWRWALILTKWVLWTYPRHRRDRITDALSSCGDHVRVVHLRRRRDVSTFLDALATN